MRKPAANLARRWQLEPLDNAGSLFRGLAAQGQVLDMGLVRTVGTAYQRIVLDLCSNTLEGPAVPVAPLP